jgi:hypothetical protein
VLLIWLFAIFVSIANACGLYADFEHSAVARAVHAGAMDKSDDGSDPNCAKFCADDLPILVKLKAVQDLPTGQFVLASLFVGKTFQAAGAALVSMLPAPQPLPALAVNTRFVRLAL